MLQRVVRNPYRAVVRSFKNRVSPKSIITPQPSARSSQVSMPACMATPARQAITMVAPSGGLGHLPGLPPLPFLGAAKSDTLPPSYPTGTSELFERYVRGGITHEQVWTAAHLACVSDARFCNNSSPYLRDVQSHVVSTEAMRRFDLIPAAQQDRLKKHLADDMVGLTQRPAMQVQIQRTSGSPVQFVQQFAHTHAEKTESDACAWSLQHGYTLSSEVAKKDDRPINIHSREHCANSGYIKADHTMLAWRSARCDTALKLEENLVGSCCASLSSARGDKTRARGWRQIHEGSWEYQPVLVTAMDKSLVKHLFELIRRLFGGGERHTERARLQALNSACKSVFHDGTREGRYYTIEVDGRREEVYIRAPKVVNVVLSGQAKRPGALREARSDNRDSALEVGEMLAEALHERGDTHAAQLTRAFLNDIQVLQTRDYQDAVKSLDTSVRLAMEWLHLQLAKTTLAGHELTGRTDPGIEVLLLNHILSQANLAASIGCKSGVDRTPVLGALFSAAHAYESTHGAPYDPLAATPEDTQAVRLLFTQFADAWAKPVVDLTRGVNKAIKWNSQPVAKHWYDAAHGSLKWGATSRHGSSAPQAA